MTPSRPPAIDPSSPIPLPYWLMLGGAGPQPSSWASFLRMASERKAAHREAEDWSRRRAEARAEFEAQWGPGGPGDARRKKPRRREAMERFGPGGTERGEEKVGVGGGGGGGEDSGGGDDGGVAGASTAAAAAAASSGVGPRNSGDAGDSRRGAGTPDNAEDPTGGAAGRSEDHPSPDTGNNNNNSTDDANLIQLAGADDTGA